MKANEKMDIFCLIGRGNSETIGSRCLWDELRKVTSIAAIMYDSDKRAKNK